MKKIPIAILALGCTLTAHAYTPNELREDCLAAEQRFQSPNAVDAASSAKADRCAAYLNGFADGYDVADQLAGKVGVEIRALCLPHDGNASFRLIRAVLAQFDRLPPKPDGSVSNLVASAFSRSFSCADSLEPRK